MKQQQKLQPCGMPLIDLLPGPSWTTWCAVVVSSSLKRPQPFDGMPQADDDLRLEHGQN